MKDVVVHNYVEISKEISVLKPPEVKKAFKKFPSACMLLCGPKANTKYNEAI